MKIRVDELISRLQQLPMESYVEVGDLTPIQYFHANGDRTPFCNNNGPTMAEILAAGLTHKSRVFEDNGNGRWKEWDR